MRGATARVHQGQEPFPYVVADAADAGRRAAWQAREAAYRRFGPASPEYHAAASAWLEAHRAWWDAWQAAWALSARAVRQASSR